MSQALLGNIGTQCRYTPQTSAVNQEEMYFKTISISDTLLTTKANLHSNAVEHFSMRGAIWMFKITLAGTQHNLQLTALILKYEG